MLARRWAWWLLGLVALGACGGRSGFDAPADGGTTSTTTTVIVVVPPAAGAPEAGPVDAGVADSGVEAGSGICPAPPLLEAASLPRVPVLLQAVAAGNEHTCILDGNEVWCWGQNFGGELGDGTQASRARPTKVSGVADVVDIQSGPAFDYGCWATRGSHTCALVNDGTVTCWGSNPAGDALWTVQSLTAAPVRGLGGVSAIAIGGYSNCALLRDGSASCWGTDAQAVPAIEPDAGGFGTRYTALAVGHSVFALRDDGSVWAWTSTSLGGVTSISAPQQIPFAAFGYRITAGWGHQCVLASDGSVWCWGFNTHGQVGDGTQTDRGAPVKVLAGASEVFASARATCAILRDSTVRCWGASVAGDRATPTIVPDLDKVLMLHGGMEHWCAVRLDRSVWCWGGNEAGQLGDGTTATRPAPVQVYP